MKIAFIFSGQGAQYVGMGKELYDAYPVCKNVFDRANEVLGFDIKNYKEFYTPKGVKCEVKQ